MKVTLICEGARAQLGLEGDEPAAGGDVVHRSLGVRFSVFMC